MLFLKYSYLPFPIETASSGKGSACLVEADIKDAAYHFWEFFQQISIVTDYSLGLPKYTEELWCSIWSSDQNMFMFRVAVDSGYTSFEGFGGDRGDIINKSWIGKNC